MQPGWKMNLERILVATKLFSPLDDYSSLLSGHLKVLAPCVELIGVPPNSCLPKPVCVALFGTRVFAVEMRSCQIRVGLKLSVASVPIKRGKFGHRDGHTERKTACEDRGRDWGSAKEPQGWPKPPEMRRGKGGFFPTALRGSSPRTP